MKCKLFFSTCLIFALSFLCQAQDVKPCGTVSHRSKWLKNYQRSSDQYDKRGDETIFVPLTIFLVSDDSGEGEVSSSTLLDALCTLNEDFEEANIHFYLKDGFQYLSRSEMFSHTGTTEAAFQMFELNVNHTINCYIVNNAAGNAGYNLPYAGVVLNKGFIHIDDHTWAHELGHNLSLPHPFLGWEGGFGYDGSPVGSPNSSENFQNAAPEKVLYDYTLFQDTLILDTLIIDTAFVEKTDGSNCTFAADGFCDTPPDYLAFRWPCSNTGLSPIQMTDPDGVTFRTEGSLIMSYAFDECSSRFTPEQIAAMRANLLDDKSDYLDNQIPAATIEDYSVALLSPEDGSIQAFDQIELEWQSVENATHYYIELSILEDFSFSVWSGHTTETNTIASIDPIYADRDLYWSVVPFTNYDFCKRDFVESRSLFASTTTDTKDLNSIHSLQIFPTVAEAGSTLFFESESIIDGADIYICNMSGQTMLNTTLSSNQLNLPLTWSSGIYLVQVISNNSIYTKKIMVK